PAAALQVDDGVGGGRVRALEEVVVGEGEEPPAPRELHLLEPARVPALDADAVLRELHGAAAGALAAVEREQLLAVAEHDDGRGRAARHRLLAHELPEARVAPVGRERPLHLDLLPDGRPRGPRRRGRADPSPPRRGRGRSRTGPRTRPGSSSGTPAPASATCPGTRPRWSAWRSPRRAPRRPRGAPPPPHRRSSARGASRARPAG